MARPAHVSGRPLPAAASPMSWLLFATTFVVFLAVAIAAQVLTLNWRAWLPGAEGEPSLIGGVKAAVYTVMSHVI